MLSLLHAPFGALWEEKCDDGTGYMECSSSKPGYMCTPSESVLVLQKVVGEKYPSDYPKSELAGQPTDNAVKCACDNYAGYGEKDGECVNAAAQKVTVPEQKTPSVNETPKTNNTQQNQAVEPAKKASQTAQAKADTLKVPTKTTEQPAQSFQLDTMGIAIIVVAVSVVGGLFVLGVIIVAIFAVYKLRKKKGKL